MAQPQFSCTPASVTISIKSTLNFDTEAEGDPWAPSP